MAKVLREPARKTIQRKELIMYKSKTPNLSKHLLNAIYKTALDIIKLNTISSARQNTKKMLQDTAIDSNVKDDFFDELIDDFTMDITAFANEIAEFYFDCTDNTLLRINKRQKKQDYLNQLSKIYKTVAEFVGAKFIQDFELVLAQIHYELNVEKKYAKL